jgi:hypothetical protein
MKPMRIVSAQPLKKQTLEVLDRGVTISESAGFGMGEMFRIAFADIDAVVQSATEPVLSIQVGTKIFKLTIRKDDETHRAVIARIVEGARRTLGQAQSPDEATADEARA